jgi:hypothetical protein
MLVISEPDLSKLSKCRSEKEIQNLLLDGHSGNSVGGRHKIETAAVK